MKVKIQLRHELAQLPKQATELAGGWDVVCTEIIQESSNYVRCKIGLIIQPPSNMKIMCHARSSITKTNWFLANGVGLGDADYLGEYEFRFRCLPVSTYVESSLREISDYDKSYKIIENYSALTYEEFPYKVGDRIGQIYLEEVIPMEFEILDLLKPTTRGEGGFGSTN